MGNNIKVKQGPAALDFMMSDQFIEKWKLLYEKCDWATIFQSEDFVLPWFATYSQYRPLVFFQYGEDSCLIGLLILAIDEDGRLSFAGTHHAEYKAWLECPDSDDFILGAFKNLIKMYPDFVINISYIKDISLINALNKYMAEYVHVSRLPAYKKILSKESVYSSLKKKGNKSKIKRLEALGEIEFKRVMSPDEFEKLLAVCCVYHDVRQGATNNSFPFSNDKNKLTFHVDLMKKNPHQLHVTALLVNNYPLGMHIGYENCGEILYSINAFNPVMPRYSIGKIIFLLLSRKLLDEEVCHFDLSPGSDEWKCSFSNESGEAYTVLLFSKKYKRFSYSFKRKVTGYAKSMLKLIGLKRSMFDEMRISKYEVAKLGQNQEPHSVIYVLNKCKLKYVNDTSGHKNNLADLVEYDSFPDGPSRQEFMNQVINRISDGESIYSYKVDDVLKCYAWKSNDDVSIAPLNSDVIRCPVRGNDVLYTIHCRDKVPDYNSFNDLVQVIVNDFIQDSEMHNLFLSTCYDSLKIKQLLCEMHGFKKV